MNAIGNKTIGTVAYLGGVMALPEPFVHSWTQMVQYNYEYLLDRQQLIKYDRSTVSYHSFARNSLVDNMQGDWLLQLDTDITFEPDILARMLHKMDKFGIDVLAGLYLYKSKPHPPVAYNYDPAKKEKTILGDWQKDADLIPLRSSGAACLLVRRSVFDRIKATGEGPFDIYFDGKAPLSEDHSFFERCWKLKIPIYAAPDVWVSHLMYRELGEKDFDRSGLNVVKVKKFW